jgi:hypothetical protein
MYQASLGMNVDDLDITMNAMMIATVIDLTFAVSVKFHVLIPLYYNVTLN